MKSKFHFISGLPRSGSTLLSAILRQNPRFHAEMSGPMAQMLGSLQKSMSARNEFSWAISDKQRETVLRGLFSNFYEDIPNDHVVFDTNRSWTGKIPLLKTLFQNSKVICCARAVTWILDSIERQVGANSLEPSKMFNYDSSGNVYSRADSLLSPAGMVGAAYNGLKTAYYGDHSESILVVPYESLCLNPQKTLQELYEFLGEDYYEHDYSKVEYSAEEFDGKMAMPDLHRVSGPVIFKERTPIIPPDIWDRFSDYAFWIDPEKNHKKTRVVYP